MIRIHKPRPREGDIRIMDKFLLFPKCIMDETRWLERARFKQKLVTKFDIFSDSPYTGWYLGWSDWEWIGNDD